MFPLSQSAYRKGSLHDFGFHMSAAKCSLSVSVCACVSANLIGLNEGSSLVLRWRPGLFLVEMLHKCFSQSREIALPSYGQQAFEIQL